MDMTVEHVTKHFGKSGISDVTFGCTPGTISAFLGPNGAGKTTTMRIMAGLQRPASGRVLFGGRNLQDYTSPARIAAFVFGPQALPDTYTVGELMSISCTALNSPKAEIRRHLEAVEMYGARHKLIRRCSLGMKQRLAIAAALLADPGCLILDEPFNGLDPDGIIWLRELLATLRRAEKTILVSTHLLREIESLTDAVVLIKAGRATVVDSVTRATPRVLCRSPQQAELVALMVQLGIRWREQAESVSIDVEPTVLLNECNRHRIDLEYLHVAEPSTLEEIYG